MFTLTSLHRNNYKIFLLKDVYVRFVQKKIKHLDFFHSTKKNTYIVFVIYRRSLCWTRSLVSEKRKRACKKKRKEHREVYTTKDKKKGPSTKKKRFNLVSLTDTHLSFIWTAHSCSQFNWTHKKWRKKIISDR